MSYCPVYNRAWRLRRRDHLRAYLRAYRKANHARLELVRKCRLAGVDLK